MTHQSKGSAMNQKIFAMNLGVETVSLYLLCCAVADAGAAITPTTLMDKWNGDQNALERELLTLKDKNILDRENKDNREEAVYRLVDEKKWRKQR